jgi:hypothetical protein
MSTRLAGHDDAACPHVLPAIMTQVLVALRICMCVLETCESSCVGRSAMPLFIHEACNPLGTAGDMATSKPFPGRDTRSEAIGHMTTSKPIPTGKRGPEPWNMWRHRSPPQPGGEVRSHWTHGSTGAHLGREVTFGAVGHVVALEPTSTGR